MKPQSEVFLEKAEELLGRAETMLGASLTEDAGRTAYLAGFHAAQALIFETHSRVFKTHEGVQGEFGRLVADEPRFDPELRAFLSQTYNLKVIADYEIGPGATISEAQAVAAIAAARHFVAAIETLLRGSDDMKIAP